MSAKLFQPITISGTEFKNRIAMSSMCMHSAAEDGCITDWHLVHYGARGLGGAALVMLETTAVATNGLVGPGDIGIWDDEQVPGLRRMVEVLHRMGAKAGAQLGHSGRKLAFDDRSSVGPSAIPFTDGARVPEPLTADGIAGVVEAFGDGARRAAQAGFDVLEIHTAHGYLLNSFLSPLANHRTDEYGGNHENRFRIVRQVIDAVRAEWSGPLFARVSTSDYADGGNTPADFVVYGRWMKELGIDLIDCSSGGIAPVTVHKYPGFQVPAADVIRREVGILTGAVGMIQSGRQAEEILQNGRADLVFVGREILKDPFWPRTAADELQVAIPVPPQYTRYGSAWQRALPGVAPAPLTSR